MTSKTLVCCQVNGQTVEALVEPRMTLADFLRQDLGLTGTHLGCEHGVCGICNVLVDGFATRSCLMLAVQAEGTEIRTVESLSDGDKLHPIQEAFMEEHGLQCHCLKGSNNLSRAEALKTTDSFLPGQMYL